MSETMDEELEPQPPRGHVKVIYFNDPVLIGEGLTTRLAGHDNHLHVRYCEAWHPVSAYRCSSASSLSAAVAVFDPFAAALQVLPLSPTAGPAPRPSR